MYYILYPTPNKKYVYVYAYVYVNTASRKSLEIQAYSITKPRTPLKQKLVWKLVFSCSNASWK